MVIQWLLLLRWNIFVFLVSWDTDGSVEFFPVRWYVFTACWTLFRDTRVATSKQVLDEMCCSRSGQPCGLPGRRKRESCSFSPQEDEVLFSSPSPPLSSPPSVLQHLSDPSRVVLAWQRTVSFLALHWLVRWPGSWEKSRRLQGREGRGEPGSSVFQQHKSPRSALLLHPGRTH